MERKQQKTTRLQYAEHFAKSRNEFFLLQMHDAIERQHSGDRTIRFVELKEVAFGEFDVRKQGVCFGDHAG